MRSLGEASLPKKAFRWNSPFNKKKDKRKKTYGVSEDMREKDKFQRTYGRIEMSGDRKYEINMKNPR